MKFRISGLKHFGIYFIVLAIIGLGIGLGVKNNKPNQSHTIVGQVISVKNGQIEMLGVHMPDSSMVAPDMTHATQVTIKTDLGTRYFNKVWPTVTKAAIEKYTSSSFQTLQSKVIQGSFADMNIKNLYIIVTTREESSQLDITTANMIKYNTIKP